jgi:hypothetical protein
MSENKIKYVWNWKLLEEKNRGGVEKDGVKRNC